MAYSLVETLKGVKLPPKKLRKKEKKLGGAHQNEFKGVYEVETEPNAPLMIKAETENVAKEFSELLAGSFLEKVVQQPGFAYARNFVLTHPGTLSFENDPSRPAQLVMVQPFAKAEKLLENRRKLEELRPQTARDVLTGELGAGRARELARQLEVNQFAATLAVSVFVDDYSLHLDNFMRAGENGALRVDFGSSFKNILKNGHNANLYQSPPGTKPYKRYVEIWSVDPSIKAAITEFMWRNQQYFNPEKMGQMMGDACREILNTAYENAPLEDLLQIYQHLHGEKHPKLTEKQLRDYDEIRNLKKQRNKILKEMQSTPPNKQVSLFARVQKLNEALHIKCFAFNQDTGVHDFKHEIKNDIINHMQKGMVQRARALIRESVQLGHDERLAQIKKESPALEAEIRKTEKEIKETRAEIEHCETYGAPAEAAIKEILERLFITTLKQKPVSGEYVELSQNGTNGSTYFLKSSIPILSESTPQNKLTMMKESRELTKAFDLLKAMQERYTASSEKLDNLNKRLHSLHTHHAAPPKVGVAEALPPPLSATAALSARPPVRTPSPATSHQNPNNTVNAEHKLGPQ